MLSVKKDNSEGDSRSIISDEELEQAKADLEEIGKERQDGFVFVIKKTKDEDGDWCAQGITKVGRVSNDFILQTVMQATGLDEAALTQYLMLRTLGRAAKDD
jgi:hypothetical protein